MPTPSRKRSICLALAASILSLGMVARLGIAEGGPLPDMTIPNSLGVQLKPTQMKGANLEKTLDEVKAMGVKVIRRGFYWESIEKTPGNFDFTEYDTIVKACKDRGMTVIGCLFGNHKEIGKVIEEKGREGYAKFAAACAEHFKGEPILWELWNEPNVMTFWGRHGGVGNSERYADEYLALVKATVPLMKKADPKCYVMAGSVSNMWSESYKWQNFSFKKGILATGIDGWSVHPYGVKSPEDYVEAYAIVRKMMVENGGSADFPMLNTERGFPIKAGGEGYAGGDSNMQEDLQAWHLARQYLVDQLSGIKLTSWYEYGGTESFALVIDDPKSDQRGRKMPAYYACRVLVDQLSGYKLEKRIDLGAPRDFALRYVNKAGDVKIVAWTGPAPSKGPETTKPHQVTIPVDAAGASTDVVQIYGEKGTTAVKDKAVTIELTGAVQYIGKAAPTTLIMEPRPAPKPVEKPAAAAETGEKTDLKLFEEGATWKFEKNTGNGSFELAKDGDKPIGVFNYDFTKKIGEKTAYVLASAKTDVPEGQKKLNFNVRAKGPHKVTLRLNDSTGQTFQTKRTIAGTGAWETISIDLTKKMEKWGGANDGKIHYPIKSFVISVPEQDEGKTGKLEFSDAATSK